MREREREREREKESEREILVQISIKILEIGHMEIIRSYYRYYTNIMMV